MNYVNIYNPEDKEVSLNFQGTVHTIGAKETKAYPEDLANHWIYIYGFMQVAKELPKKKEEAEDKPKKK